MTVGNVLARGVGKTPRGFTKRITFVGVAAIAVVACGGTSGGGTPSTSGGQDLFNPTNFALAATNMLWTMANSVHGRATKPPLIFSGTMKSIEEKLMRHLPGQFISPKSP